MRFSWLIPVLLLASGVLSYSQDTTSAHMEDLSADCCESSPWFGAYEAVIVQPHFPSNIAYRNTVGIDQAYSFDWELGYSTRIELGHARDNDRFRVRYWLYDQDVHFNRERRDDERIVIGVVGAVANPWIETNGALVGTHSIRFDVLDLELSERFEHCRGYLELGAGLRYAALTQEASWYETEGPEELYVRHESDNVGATVFGEFARQTFLPSLELVVGVRGGILFGERSLLVLDEVDYGEFIEPHNAILPFTEIDAGINFSPNVSEHFNATFSVGYEAQLWIDAGSAAAEYTEPPDQQNLGFTGFVCRLMISY